MAQGVAVPHQAWTPTTMGFPPPAATLPAPTQVFVNANDIAARANSLMSQAMTAAAAIGSIAGTLQVPAINPAFPTIPTAPAPINLPDPTVLPITWTAPVQPAANYGELGNLEGYLPGAFTDAAPVLSFGTAPAPDFGVAPDAPAVDLNIALPDKPSITLPAAPPLMTINTIPFDAVTLPTFDATAPVLTLTPPNVVGYTEGPAYTSQLLTSLRRDLQAAIDNGTNISLPTKALVGLFDQARENEFRLQREAIASLDDMEAMGFSMPPGVYLDARLKVLNETNAKMAGLNRDIMVKQADVTLQNLAKARDDAAALEGKMIDFTNQVAQRAFEAAKFQTEALVSIYNAGIESYKAQMAGYSARAQVYDVQVRGALAIVDIYKTRVQAELAKAEINTALVNSYKAQIDAALSAVEIYKAELQGVSIAAELQKTKIEVFGEQIKGYVGRIQAFSAEVEAYKTGVQAQATVQEAYTARVGAYKATVDAGVAMIDGKVKGFQARIAGYEASLKGFSASLEGMVQQAKATAEFNTSSVEVYRAKVQGIAAYNELLTKQWSAAVEISEKQAEVGIKAAEVNVQAYLQAKQIAIEAAKTAAQVSAQLGAAAFGAIHFSNSVSWASSQSQSLAASASYSAADSASSSDSYSTSTSDNKNYSESKSV